MFEIIIQTQFIAMHCWPNAPDQVAYLRDPHRHTFTVRAEKAVTHADRDIEFIMLKEEVDEWISGRPKVWCTEMSCEHWAEAIGRQFGFDRVEVLEDGENGGRWSRDLQTPRKDNTLNTQRSET